MNFSFCVTSLIVFLWISLFCGATASLDCSFAVDTCDWKQTVKQCSWEVNRVCFGGVKGCAFVNVNSGKNCSSVGLTASIGSQRTRGIYFEYLIFSYGVRLHVKDDKGKILWSCSKSADSRWHSAQIFLKNGGHAKAITLEANFSPNSRGLVIVRNIQGAVRMKASTTCNPNRVVRSTHAAAIPTSSLSTMKNFSDRLTTSSSLKTSAKSIGTTKAQAAITTTRASKTTRRQKENPSTHAQTDGNRLTKTRPTTLTEKIKASTSHSASPANTHTAVTSTPSPSTTKKSSDRVTTSSSLKSTSRSIGTTGAQAARTTTKASKTTSRPKKNPSTHAQKDGNRSSGTHLTTPTEKIKVGSSYSTSPVRTTTLAAKTKSQPRENTSTNVRTAKSTETHFTTPTKKIKAGTSHSTSSASLSTTQDSSVHLTSRSHKTTARSIRTTEVKIAITTPEASKTTSRPEENMSTHAQTKRNQFIDPVTQPTTPGETDQRTPSKRIIPVKPVDSFPSQKPKKSVASLIGVLVGIISSIFLLVIFTIVTVKWLRKSASSTHMYTLLHMNPEFRS